MKRRTLLKAISLSGLGAIYSLDSIARPERQAQVPTIAGSEDENWKLLREYFPLDMEMAYLNNGTIGPNPIPVLDAIKNRLDSMSSVVDYGGWHKARAVFGKFIGASGKEIALTSNTTHGSNIISQGVRMKRGREIITTTHEHVGNAMPLLIRAKKDRLKIRVFDPALTQKEVLNQVEALISRKTAMICIPHISCTTGQVFPIAEISQMIEGKNIFLAVDGAHGPGSRTLDVKSLGCDSYAANCHKWMMGAYGTGFLYIKEERIPELEVVHSGHANSSSWKLLPEESSFELRDDNAARFMFGTQSTAQFEGSMAAVDFINEIGTDQIGKRIEYLQNYLLEGLKGKESVLDILSPEEKESHGPMLTIKPGTLTYQEFYLKAKQQGIVTRQLAEANLNAIRISTHIYNSTEELDRLLNFIDDVL